MVTLVSCTAREAEGFRELLGNIARANRDATVAFAMFCRAHDLPDEAQLQSVTTEGLMVLLPDAP